MQPVLIMASGRSGANLLRRMLAAHSEVAGPPPLDLWRVFHPLIGSYGALDEHAGWSALVEDMLTLCRASQPAWKHALAADEVARRMVSTSLSGAAGALYESFAAREGARVWVCAERELFHHAPRIAEVYPEARVLYLARDGRDVACSQRARSAPGRDPYPLALAWREEQRRAIEVYRDLLPSGRCRLLRYEELIDATELVLRTLCEWLGLGFEERMLGFHRDPETRDEARGCPAWQDLDKPLSSTHCGRHRRELDAAQLGRFEAGAREELRLLGYPLETGGRVSRLGRWLLAARDRRWRARHHPRTGERPGNPREELLGALRERRGRIPAPPLAPVLDREPGS